MKALELAFATILFNVVATMVVATGLFPGGYGIADGTTNIPSSAQLNSTISGLTGDFEKEGNVGTTGGEFGFLLFFISGGAGLAIQILMAPFALPFIMVALGVPSLLATVVGIGVMLVYIIALAQIFTGRGVKDDE